MNLKSSVRLLSALAAALFTGVSCVSVDENLGKDLIATDQMFDIHTVEIPLTGIRMEMADSLSGLSSKRIALGAVRDAQFGLTTRSCVLQLLPAFEDLDYGKDPELKYMHFSAALDTVSVPTEADRYLIQNVRVYELAEPVDLTKARTNATIAHKGTPITDGGVVYGGSDSLSFNFSREFAERYMTITTEDTDTLPNFTKRFPGLYIEMEPPTGNGGRINLFKLSCLTYNSSYGTYLLNGNCVRLHFNAEYDGVRKDTSFVFIYGEPDFLDENTYIENKQKFPQYAYNLTGHETRPQSGSAGNDLFVEGGGGLKPVIDAQALLDAAKAEISQYGDPAKAVISRAQINLPFEYDGDYETLGTFFPSVLSPTCRIVTDGVGASFAGLSDSSASDEDQGSIHRDRLCYSPDVAHHLQQLLRMEDGTDMSNYDIWLLIMATETETTANTTDNSYYQNLAYYSYLNSLYNGYGYGGYGGYGYGGYGYGGYGGYNSYYNYYNYAMMAAMMNQSSTTTSTTTELDRDRYYSAKLLGPTAAGGRVPTLTLTYAIPKE